MIDQNSKRLAPSSRASPDLLSMSTVSTSSCSNHASESPTAVDSFRLRFRPTGSIRQTLFGKVLAAEDTRTRGSVVVKSSSKVAVQLSQSAESPSNELRVLQRIERSGGHPKIVRLLGWHEDEKNILLALEKCSGGDLLSAIQRRGGEGLSEDVARAVARQLIGAIGYLHKLGLAHLALADRLELFLGWHAQQLGWVRHPVRPLKDEDRRCSSRVRCQRGAGGVFPQPRPGASTPLRAYANARGSVAFGANSLRVCFDISRETLK